MSGTLPAITAACFTVVTRIAGFVLAGLSIHYMRMLSNIRPVNALQLWPSQQALSCIFLSLLSDRQAIAGAVASV